MGIGARTFTAPSFSSTNITTCTVRSGACILSLSFSSFTLETTLQKAEAELIPFAPPYAKSRGGSEKCYATTWPGLAYLRAIPTTDGERGERGPPVAIAA